MPQDSPQNRKSAANPYRTVSASERRARRQAREAGRVRIPVGDEPGVRSVERAKPALSNVLPQEMINELLANPTKVVTEEDLRRDYSYVIADLRNMALLSVALVVLLVALALLLP
jgi:hypothetical protein